MNKPRFTVPWKSAKAGKKFVNLLTTSDLAETFVRQPFMKKIINLAKESEPNIESMLSENLKARKVFKDVIATRFIADNNRNVIGIDANKFWTMPKGARREILAHEAFHANAPMGLGNSEILAHLYGGVKSNRIGVAMVRLLTRKPIRTTVEIAPVVAGGTIINKLRKEKNG